ncbi:hypothetical protein MMC34_006793 [Xylographa carneopallida]|nr:hypothetical protein [Xylographa carneopallida]
MTAETQPTSTSPQTTPSPTPSSQPHDSSNPDPTTDMTAATPPLTFTKPTEPTGPETTLQPKNTVPASVLESEAPPLPIEAFDWAGLEARYHADMQACADTDTGLFEEFNQAIRIFEAWASVTTTHESERSSKRLKTRMCYVQGDEQHLEKKRQHHMKVVAAFQDALALLREP